MHKFLILSFLPLICSCATIVRSNSQMVGFSSTPSNANVIVYYERQVPMNKGNNRDLMTIQDELYCTTPCSLNLPRKNEIYRVIIDKEGYSSGSATLVQSLSGWLWGNIFFGGIIGLIVDINAGGAYDLKPAYVHADLIKYGMAPQNK